LNVAYARATNVEWLSYVGSPPHDLQVELISSAASEDSYNVFKATYTNVSEFTVIVHHNPLRTVSGIGNIQLSSDGSWWWDFGFSFGWSHFSGTLVGGFYGHFENLNNLTTALSFQSLSYKTGQLWVRFQRHAIS
jgi:phage terminase large subunit-like protein